MAVVLQVLKQCTSRRLKSGGGEAFWQRRYYDFNVWSEKKRVEKLRYIHRNPVVHKLDSPVITTRHCAVFLNAVKDLHCFGAFANSIIP